MPAETPDLPPNQHLAAPGKWPLVGEKSPRTDDSPWAVTVRGEVQTPHTFTLSDLAGLPQVEQTVDIHCVTRWSKLGATFGGVLLSDLLQIAGFTPSGRFASFIARSERGHSTSLLLADALALKTVIAFRYEGEPLETIHGGPVRVVVPGRYFYKSLKWLETIELLPEDRLGYWEAEAGYHNHADPWHEERYIAPNVPRHVLETALQRRDFSNLDLRGLNVSKRDLTGLFARNAKLRDAHFEQTNLQNADFSGANLSNAHLTGANLQNAHFTGADVEGADFTGADLRGTDFTGASLFGATFCTEQGTRGAMMDEGTHFTLATLDALAPLQRAFLLTALPQLLL